MRELYQEVILDHNKRPRNKGVIEEASHRAEGHNPLCGDQVAITLVLRDGLVEQVKFDGQGCAISTASASMLTEAVLGKTPEEARALSHAFYELVTDHASSEIDYGELAALEGVKDFPTRVKCATLAWHTLESALEGKGA